MCLLGVVPTSVSISWDRSASSLLMKLPGMGLRTTAFPVGHLSSGRGEVQRNLLLASDTSKLLQLKITNIPKWHT